MSSFYAAFTQESYHIEGDERSRTNPGHGYPAHTIQYTKVTQFDDEESMMRFVEEQESRHSKIKYKIVYCTEMEVKKTVKVEVFPSTEI